MTPADAMDIARSALWTLLLAMTPVMLPALAVALVVGFVQAATSINEAVIGFVPKLLTVIAALALSGSLVGGMLGDFFTGMFWQIAAFGR